jgi:hypothetical protein
MFFPYTLDQQVCVKKAFYINLFIKRKPLHHIYVKNGLSPLKKKKKWFLYDVLSCSMTRKMGGVVFFFNYHCETEMKG